MKIRINPFHHPAIWLCIYMLILTTLPARPKPIPRSDAAGPAIGVALLVCGGVVIYCMIRTCQKVFGTNGTNHAIIEWPSGVWISNQSPVCIEIDTCRPCDCGPSQSLASFGIVHELQRSTNLADWDIIDTQWGGVDDLYFSDYDPPQSGAIYRLVSW